MQAAKRIPVDMGFPQIGGGGGPLGTPGYM